MEKYYTPTIEEFHVGFEYQSLQDGRSPEMDASWSKEVIETSADLEEFLNYYNHDHIDDLRVKYLDKEDIESLGWIQEPIDSKFKSMYHLEAPIYKIINNGTFLLTTKLLTNKIIIKSPNFIRDGSGNFKDYITKAYELEIKNKSELSKLMKQLNII